MEFSSPDRNIGAPRPSVMWPLNRLTNHEMTKLKTYTCFNVWLLKLCVTLHFFAYGKYTI